jgi:hypothetical protein
MLKIQAVSALLLALVLAACGAGGAPIPTPVPTPVPTPTAVPGPGGVGGGGGAGSGGSAGSAIVPPGGIVDPGGGANPILGQARFVSPVAGLIDQRPISVQLVRAAADGAAARAELRWWGGVAPCSQLDSVKIDKDESAKTIRLSAVEGSGPGEMACIDIAQLTATVVDLGVLAAGSWKISADGDAPAITLDIS